MVRGKPDENAVQVPLDEWMKLVGERLVREAVDKAIEAHVKACPARSIIREYIKPAIVAAITSVIAIFIGSHK